MVDTLILLATGLACVYVALMAAYRDTTTPWYSDPDAQAGTPPAATDASSSASSARSGGWRSRRGT